MSLQNRNGTGNLVVVLAFCFSSLRTTSIGDEYGPNSPRGRPASNRDLAQTWESNSNPPIARVDGSRDLPLSKSFGN